MREVKSLVTRHLGGALVCAALAGCAVAPSQRPAAGTEALCHEVFQRVDHAVTEAGVGDGMAARVAGFPYLRANRFLASYAREELRAAQFDQWLERMMILGREARRIELANLPAASREALEEALQEIGEHAPPRAAVEACATQLAAADRARPERRAELRGAVSVPDDYATWQRIVGLYWITRIPFASGVSNWQQEVHATFARPLDALPVTGRLATYTPPPGPKARTEIAALLARASANPLGIPEPVGADLEALFHAFAPRFVVDTRGAADVPGAVGWGTDSLPHVAPHPAVVYRRASHARYEGRALLQLNYAIWFPERPLEAGWDILGGRLDGVLWRVTLAPDGEPWVYDTIHHCGCYHQFFPTPRAALKPQPDTLDEGALVPQRLPRADSNTRITLRLASGTHYLERIVLDGAPAGPAAEYVFAEDDTLRSLPLNEAERRSVFRPDGIVPGSERGERWLFWPMGVPEPGAQRQWGRHATAFVGRRHFDDPGLLERYFDLR